MFMQRIRRATKKHRTLLIIVIVLLCIGVVGTFGSMDKDYSAQGGNTDVSIADQVAFYEAQIEENEPATVEELDYAAAMEMVSLFSNYYTVCMNGYQETYNEAMSIMPQPEEEDISDSTPSDATVAPVEEPAEEEPAEEDPAEAEAAAAYQDKLNEAFAYYAKATAAADKISIYYQQAIDQAPEVITDLSLGQMYAGMGAAKLLSGNSDVETVKLDMDKALELAPEDISVNLQYANFLTTHTGYAAAIDHLTAFQATLAEDDANYEVISQYISSYQVYGVMYGEIDPDSLSAGAEEPGDEEEPGEEEPANEEAGEEAGEEE